MAKLKAPNKEAEALGRLMTNLLSPDGLEALLDEKNAPSIQELYMDGGKAFHEEWRDAFPDQDCSVLTGVASDARRAWFMDRVTGKAASDTPFGDLSRLTVRERREMAGLLAKRSSACQRNERLNPTTPAPARHDRSRHDRSQRDRSQRDESRRDESRHDMSRHDSSRRDESRHDMSRHDSSRRDESRHDRSRHDRSRHDRSRYDRSQRDESRHDRSRHDRSRHDRSRHDQGSGREIEGEESDERTVRLVTYAWDAVRGRVHYMRMQYIVRDDLTEEGLYRLAVAARVITREGQALNREVGLVGTQGADVAWVRRGQTSLLRRELLDADQNRRPDGLLLITADLDTADIDAALDPSSYSPPAPTTRANLTDIDRRIRSVSESVANLSVAEETPSRDDLGLDVIPFHDLDEDDGVRRKAPPRRRLPTIPDEEEEDGEESASDDDKDRDDGDWDDGDRESESESVSEDGDEEGEGVGEDGDEEGEGVGEDGDKEGESEDERDAEGDVKMGEDRRAKTADWTDVIEVSSGSSSHYTTTDESESDAHGPAAKSKIRRGEGRGRTAGGAKDDEDAHMSDADVPYDDALYDDALHGDATHAASRRIVAEWAAQWAPGRECDVAAAARAGLKDAVPFEPGDNGSVADEDADYDRDLEADMLNSLMQGLELKIADQPTLEAIMRTFRVVRKEPGPGSKEELPRGKWRIAVPGVRPGKQPLIYQTVGVVWSNIKILRNAGGDRRMRMGMTMGHVPGMGKTGMMLLDYHLNNLKLAMQADVERTGERGGHCTHANGRTECGSDRARWGGMRCICEPDHALRDFQQDDGMHLHITEPGLLNQLLEEWHAFFDMDAIRDLLGDRYTFALAYPKKGIDDRHRHDLVEVGTNAMPEEVAAFLQPDVTTRQLSRTFGREMSRDVHGLIRRWGKKELAGDMPPRAAAKHDRPGLLFMATTDGCLASTRLAGGERLMSTTYPGVGAAGLPSVVTCKGGAATCAVPVSGHQPDRRHSITHATFSSAPIATAPAVRIRKITKDEAHTDISEDSKFHASIREICRKHSAYFDGVTPMVEPMTGTPCAGSPWAMLAYLRAHLTPQTASGWKRHPVLQRYAGSAKSVREVHNAWQTVHRRAGEGQGYREATDAWMRQWAADAKDYIRDHMIRFHEDSELWDGERILVLPPRIERDAPCRNPKPEPDGLRPHRESYASSATALATLKREEKERLEEARPAKRGKTGKKGADADVKALKSQTRPYLMLKDFPTAVNIPELDPGREGSLLLCGNLARAGFFDVPERHPAIRGGHGEMLAEGSGKVGRLVGLLTSYWADKKGGGRPPPPPPDAELLRRLAGGKGARKDGVADLGTVDRDFIHGKHALDPVIVTVKETPLAFLVIAALRARLPNANIQGLFPGTPAADRSRKQDAFVRKPLPPRSGAGDKAEPTRYPRPIDVLVLPVSVGAVGLNLTASALTVFFDVVTNYVTQRQVQGRNWRFGQKREVRYVQLILEDDGLDLALRDGRERRSAIIAPLLQDDDGRDDAGRGEGGGS